MNMSKNTSNKDVIANEPNAFIFGGDVWKLIAKYTNESKGIMKSTKVMDCEGSVVIQVTTQQRNSDGSYSMAEALTTVTDACIRQIWNKDNSKVIGREVCSNIPEENI